MSSAVPYQNLDEIERLAAHFVERTLPCPAWTHQAHLTVGLWHAREYPPAEALDRVRSGIQRYNLACGVENTTTRGYHETLTRFYMAIIHQYLASLADRSDWVVVTNGLVEQFGARDLPLRYYSKDRLMSVEARLGWVEPDLRPLDAGVELE